MPLADPATSRPGARPLRTVRSASRPAATEMRSSSTEKRGRPPFAGQVAGEADVAVAERRIAEQVVDGAGGEVGDQRAVGVEVHGRGRGKLGAMDAGGAQPGFDLGCIGGAVEMQFAGEVAAPAGVGAEEQAGELAELRLAPFQVKVHRHLAQFRRLAQICLQAHNAGVGLFEAEVGADGLAAQPDAPVAGTLLPEGQVGVEQGKGQLFRAVLDVDAGVCGLQVGQPDGLAGSGRRCPHRIEPGRWPCAGANRGSSGRGRCAPGSGWPRPR